ncbi:MAG: ClpXP protease specificity-enhancing factor [Pseudomonadales bacterium]|nr:ClpXP protease specificity-enhancing factor [Pseudomonadales bacterium]MBO6594248.1 ClpXP protease specificity-enhancing factor [Pseudomonadales bacterium]MBO6822191.1 ClpXP protease specificity-enhancing factor [Pseudomonadales bacterium]
MNSSVPYLIQAINEWILDNDCTPYLIVDATMDDVSVPMEYVKDGQIVLNISPTAIRNLSISSEYVMFSGRFSGVAYEIYAPISAVMGIIAKENGEGMWFPREEGDPTDTPPENGPPADDVPTASPDGPPKEKGPPTLKVVK